MNGHDGLVGDLAADFIVRDGDQTIFSIGPRAHWGDNTFHDAYFGVPLAIPAASLTAYDPGGGFYSVGGRAGPRNAWAATGACSAMRATTA